MSFASLGLTSALVRAARELGLTEPTPIQAQAIPAALAGNDVRGQAQTGSGKTAAFALPILQRLLQAERHERTRSTRALILVHTRELAAQVGKVIEDLNRFMLSPPKLAVVFGGVSINPQMMALRGGADIVVATPGRLLDLVEHKALSLSAVSMLVLDEADRLLDLGFAEEWARIKDLLPARRQNLLFSATFSPEAQALADALLHSPVCVEIAADSASAPDIKQRAIHVDAAQRTQLLRHLIELEGWSQVLVFVATKYATELVADKLGRKGIKATALHGDLSQGARVQALEDFKQRKLTVLVCTDLAARGLHMPALPVVVNYDLPRAATDYTHRIGRTGRAGEAGMALSFVSAASEAHFRLIEKREGQRVPREQIEGFEPKDEVSPEQAAGGVKGVRKSKKDKLREALASEKKT